MNCYNCTDNLKKVYLFTTLRVCSIDPIRNTYNDNKKSHIRGFWSYWSTKWLLNYQVSAKFCRNVFPNLLKKRNLTAIPLILNSELQSIECNLNNLGTKIFKADVCQQIHVHCGRCEGAGKNDECPPRFCSPCLLFMSPAKPEAWNRLTHTLYV